MSSTNKTANYELSQFVGTDIPSILSDYNGDMRKIDAGIAEVATSAGSSASAVSALAGRVTTAENSITSLNGALEVTNQRSIQNQTAITAVQGVIPSDASTENLLVTNEVVSDIADDVRGINDVIPANASTSNKLATMSDIQNGLTIQSVTISKSGHSTYSSLLNAVKTKITELGLFQHPEKLIAIEEEGGGFYPFGGIDDNGTLLHFTVNRDSMSGGSVSKWTYEILLSGSSQKFDYLTAISTNGASNYTINDNSSSTPSGNFKIHYFE